MRPADGKCSYVFKGKKFPRGEGKSIISHNSQEMGEGRQLLGAAKHRAVVDGANTELGCISTQGEL